MSAQTANGVIQRATELKSRDIYPAELLAVQPFTQSVVKLLWLLPDAAELGMQQLIEVIRRLDWRTGNGRPAGEKAVRAALKEANAAGWVQIHQPRKPAGEEHAGMKDFQRYLVFRERENNPEWTGAGSLPALLLPQLALGIPMGQVDEPLGIPLGVSAGETTYPNGLGSEGEEPIGIPSGDGVSAGETTYPNGLGSEPVPPHTPPSGVGRKVGRKEKTSSPVVEEYPPASEESLERAQRVFAAIPGEWWSGSEATERDSILTAMAQALDIVGPSGERWNTANLVRYLVGNHPQSTGPWRIIKTRLTPKYLGHRPVTSYDQPAPDAPAAPGAKPGPRKPAAPKLPERCPSHPSRNADTCWTCNDPALREAPDPTPEPEQAPEPQWPTLMPDVPRAERPERENLTAEQEEARRQEQLLALAAYAAEKADEPIGASA